jgi:hypothetical protein
VTRSKRASTHTMTSFSSTICKMMKRIGYLAPPVLASISLRQGRVGVKIARRDTRG